LPVVVDRILSKGLEDIIVVSPDVGFAKQARRYASLLGTSMAIADKERIAHDEKASILQIIGNVKGKTAVVVDDFTISGGTLARVSETLIEQVAKAVYAVVTHAVITDGSGERIDNNRMNQILLTYTVEKKTAPSSNSI